MKLITYNSKLKTNSGFTIMELMVAMALFVILISIASGGFVKSLRSQRTMVGLVAANDNAGLTLEQMTREIRFGYNFVKISETEFQFVNSNNVAVSYRLYDGAIERGTENQSPEKTYKKITADNVLVNSFGIIMDGEAPSDGKQPRITITLSISAKGKQFEGFSTNIQTTISPRTIDS
jgi:prepilin-type N-terminal cleavage/methylation domain-containing protein